MQHDIKTSARRRAAQVGGLLGRMKGQMKRRLMMGVIAMAGLLLGDAALQARDMLLGVEFSGKIHWIDPTTGAAAQIGTGPGGMNSLATDSSGRIFSVAQNKLWEIDPLTGATALVANVPADIRGLAFSPSDVLYGIRDGSPDRLVIINQANGAVATVGSTGLSALQALEFAPDGTLYAIDLFRGLVRINTSTGQATDVNPSVGGGAQALTITPAGVAYRGTANAIHLIDLQTGVSSLIGGSGYNDLRGLAHFQASDTTPPTVHCTVAQGALWPPNHQLADVGLSVTATDDQDPNPTVAVYVYSSETDNGTGDGDTAGDAELGAGGSLALRAERSGNNYGRVYLIIVTATDAAGNVGYDCCTVVVPHDKSKKSAGAVATEAAAAEQYCHDHGAALPGYTLIGSSQ